MTSGGDSSVVTVRAENRAIQPDGEGFQDEFKRLDVRMYEVE